MRADAILSPLVIGRDDDEPTIEQAQDLRHIRVSSGGNSARRDSQPLSFSASSVWGVSTWFRLKIGMTRGVDRVLAPQTAQPSRKRREWISR